MALFTNFATLSYNGGIINSNTVTGELLENVSAVKTAVMDDYTAGDDVTYIITLLNSDETAMTGVTVTDDLGGYAYDGGTVYPLAYTAGSIRYYINGVLQPAPAVTAGPPMVIGGISVPAGGNVMLIYEAAVTSFAPLAAGSSITNTATVTGPARALPLTASGTIGTEDRADLYISKAVSPSVVEAGDQLTYTFVIENVGNTAAAAADNVVLSDTFDPVLDTMTVTFNGTTWAAGTNYTYDAGTGMFATAPGQITVPAATYAQNTDGEWVVTPGTATLVITGTVPTAS